MHSTLEHRPIRRALFAGVVGLALLAVVIGAVLSVVIGGSVSHMRDAVERADTLAGEAATLRSALLDQETGLRGYQLTGEDAFLQPYRVGIRAEQGALDALLVTAQSEPLVLALREVSQEAEDWRSSWAIPQLSLVAQGDLDAVAEAVATGGGKRRFDLIRGALGRVDLGIGEVRRAAIASIGEAQQFVLVVIGAAVIIFATALLGGGWWMYRRIAQPLHRLVGTAEALERGVEVQFVAARHDEIGTLAETLERMQQTIRQRYETATELADRSTVFNRLSELVSYAGDETAIIRAGTAAFERLVPNRGGEVLLVNPSFDQLRVHSVWGDVPTSDQGRLAVDRPTACPGIRRNTVHLTRSALDAFSLTCEVHPLRSGSLLCVPMVSLNEILGVIHLEREAEDAFDDEDLRSASRVAEHIALAMANLRLVRRMETQAMTDPLTGLANARFFDPLVERELASSRREGRPVGIVMLDIDHFKQFNDSHGHPAGDEALRAFARAVRGSLRETDTAARYGGEEFAILLRNTDLAGAVAVAEKLRTAIELTPIEIGPNRFARISASLGVAASDTHGTDRMQLMRLADGALYEAKRGGRNRVAAASAATVPAEAKDAGPTRLKDRGKRPNTTPSRRAAAGGGFDPSEKPTV
ncbi:MAG: diguanylate cyclase [Chloroflexi bacterium]|nr:diguanylate cyclase [Chloroflexota bacterium]